MTTLATVLTAGIALAEKEKEFDPNTASPGVAGFIAVAVLAVAVILLLLDMNRRLRRSRIRGEVHEQIAAEAAEAAARAGQAGTQRNADAVGDAPTVGDAPQDPEPRG